MLLKTKNTSCLNKLFLSLMLIFVCSTLSLAQSPAQAREDFSEDELESFVNAYAEVQAIQDESDQKVMEAIESGELSVDRFNEILTQQQDPAKKADATAEEMAAFNDAAQAIIQERQVVEKKMVSAIEEEGIDINVYQEIMVAYQQSPKVQKKVNELMEQ